MSMAVVTVRQAKAQLSKLIARAEAGQEIIIARGREPAVKCLQTTFWGPEGPAGRDFLRSAPRA
jgi:hypothetical protein